MSYIHKILNSKKFNLKVPKELEEELDRLSFEGWDLLGTLEERFLVLNKELIIDEGKPIEKKENDYVEIKPQEVKK